MPVITSLLLSVGLALHGAKMSGVYYPDFTVFGAKATIFQNLTETLTFENCAHRAHKAYYTLFEYVTIGDIATCRGVLPIHNPAKIRKATGWSIGKCAAEDHKCIGGLEWTIEEDQKPSKGYFQGTEGFIITNATDPKSCAVDVMKHNWQTVYEGGAPARYSFWSHSDDKGHQCIALQNLTKQESVQKISVGFLAPEMRGIPTSVKCEDFTEKYFQYTSACQNFEYQASNSVGHMPNGSPTRYEADPDYGWLTPPQSPLTPISPVRNRGASVA